MDILSKGLFEGLRLSLKVEIRGLVRFGLENAVSMKVLTKVDLQGCVCVLMLNVSHILKNKISVCGSVKMLVLLNVPF